VRKALKYFNSEEKSVQLIRGVKGAKSKYFCAYQKMADRSGRAV
jgi:hypothetical protein